MFVKIIFVSVFIPLVSLVFWCLTLILYKSCRMGTGIVLLSFVQLKLPNMILRSWIYTCDSDHTLLSKSLENSNWSVTGTYINLIVSELGLLNVEISNSLNVDVGVHAWYKGLDISWLWCYFIVAFSYSFSLETAILGTVNYLYSNR